MSHTPGSKNATCHQSAENNLKYTKFIEYKYQGKIIEKLLHTVVANFNFVQIWLLCMYIKGTYGSHKRQHQVWVIFICSSFRLCRLAPGPSSDVTYPG